MKERINSRSIHNPKLEDDFIIRIKKVNSLQLLKEFYQVPFDIYEDINEWVPPFWKEFYDFFKKDNLFWTHAEACLFVGYKNNRPVGRIAAFIDRLYCKHIQKNIGFFGYFESIDEPSLAEKLFFNAEEWMRKKDVDLMQGPIDGRIDNGCGFLCKGFDKNQSVLSTYTPDYYISYAEQYDFKKNRDLFTYSIDLTKPLPDQLKQKAEACKNYGFSVRSFNRMRTGKELKWWIPFFLETFRDHYGFVPVERKEVLSRYGVKQLRWLVDTDLFLIVERNDDPVAYLWATPDYNQIFKNFNGKLGFFEMVRFLREKKKINRGKLHLIGIEESVRRNHVASLLNYEALQVMKKKGYEIAEVGWIDEKNSSAHKTISLTEAQVSKKHRVFEKQISG